MKVMDQSGCKCFIAGAHIHGLTFYSVGTAVEHHSKYQYQFVNAQNVFAGQIQTETAYYQVPLLLLSLKKEISLTII